MITNFFIPELNNHDVQELRFLQDGGATCHPARATIDLLKVTFGDRLILRFGPVNWPPRSCDLTPLDYFLWGYVKALVYADKPQTLDHLEDNIRYCHKIDVEIAVLPPDACELTDKDEWKENEVNSYEITENGFLGPWSEGILKSHSLSSLLNNLRAFGDGPVARVSGGQGIESWLACLEFEPSATKDPRVGQRCTLNLSRVEMSSRWCDVVVRRGGASSGVALVI
ncbi:putative LOC100569746 [Trichonephila clavipes]|nr:putative LOC100569746 [Trichonephila clavipes]